ncbi:MAG: pro-sigmaK processing inhibitor BofA family protein [Lachnospirales bacterium]
MENNSIILFFILICSGLLIFVTFNKQVSFLIKFLTRGLLGFLGFSGLNFVLGFFGIQVGVNLLTIGFVGLLGIWGFVTMLALQLIL